MIPPKVTIAIPTYNRAALLREALASALAQNSPSLGVLILDNASTDDTGAAVRSFADKRITYCRSAVNLGMIPNLNRAVELNRSQYLCVLLDDDRLLPDFTARCATLLDAHPGAGFALARAAYVDASGSRLATADDDLWSSNPPTGVVPGHEYLHLNTAVRRGGNPSTAMFRASALAAVGGFDSPHSRHATELNLYLRLASRFDVALVNEELVHVRLHAAQASHIEWGASRIGYVSEYIDAIAHLLGSERAADPEYRLTLSRRLRRLNARRSEEMAHPLPELYWTWAERLDMVARELARVIPPGSAFLLADDDEFGSAADLPERRRIPFTERDGVYWGPPPDEAAAHRELDRWRQAGVHYLAVGWPAFSWLDCFPAWADRLLREFPCVLENSRVLVFQLGAP